MCPMMHDDDGQHFLSSLWSAAFPTTEQQTEVHAATTSSQAIL
jgi:hypothetical protein